MQLHTHFYSLSLHSEIVNQITHGSLTCSPIVQQEPDYIRVIHSLAGVTTIEQIEGEPARFSHPLIGEPRRTLNDFGFPLKVQHGAFHQKPMVVLHSLRLSTLLSERQHISITLNLAATWSKPLNSNQRTTSECRDSFGRMALNTV